MIWGSGWGVSSLVPASRAPVGYQRMSLPAGWLFADSYTAMIVYFRFHGDGWNVSVGIWPEGRSLEAISRASLKWPLDETALADLRWYLEEYLRAPFGVWEDRGPRIEKQLASWGEAIFGWVFRAGPARDAY